MLIALAHLSCKTARYASHGFSKCRLLIYFTFRDYNRLFLFGFTTKDKISCREAKHSLCTYVLQCKNFGNKLKLLTPEHAAKTFVNVNTTHA